MRTLRSDMVVAGGVYGGGGFDWRVENDTGRMVKASESY